MNTPAGEPWQAKLLQGEAEAAWDLFIGRYRRLILATIKHYVHDPEEVMDVFADLCGVLSANELALLARYKLPTSTEGASFPTWLVTVVRNHAIDWLRRRAGRRRSDRDPNLTPIQQQIFEHVFIGGRSHVEAYELVRSAANPELSFREFLREVTATYRIAGAGRWSHGLRDMAGALPLADSGASAEDEAMTADASARLASALSALEEDERLAIRLFVIHEMPAADVARVVRWPNAKTVYNRVYRALATLRAALERQGVRRGDL